jgi:predicted O-methyltransferase YrrM
MSNPQQQHPTTPGLRQAHQVVSKVPGLLGAYRKVKNWSKNGAVPVAVYQGLFERRRLNLPVRAAEEFSPAAGQIELPAHYPLFAGEDAPLDDMLFLCNLARGRQARRILEVGTYRARTTYAFHLNCPDAEIVSYDIQQLDSRYRKELLQTGKVSLRHASFSASADTLRKEPKFDLIFVDGSHRLEAAVEDSRLALELVAPGGIIVWHDYRLNGRFEDELRVPEALDVISQSVPVCAVACTTCAVYENKPSA